MTEGTSYRTPHGIPYGMSHGITPRGCYELAMRRPVHFQIRTLLIPLDLPWGVKCLVGFNQPHGAPRTRYSIFQWDNP